MDDSVTPSVPPAALEIPISFIETYTVRCVPRHARTEPWLTNTVADLEDAAQEWQVPFIVGREKIREKILETPNVAVLQNAQRVVAFVATADPVRLQRTGLRARYIAGTIGHPKLGGKGKFDRLMDAIGNRCELEILHTQNPHVARLLTSRNQGVFPTANLDRRLTDALRSDLIELMDILDRRQPFSPITGIVPNEYDRPLYKQWPFPGSEHHASFRNLPNDRSAVLVVAFAAARDAAKWLMPNGAR